MQAHGCRLVAAAATAGALLVSGCGGEDDFENNPRPPAPIVVSASINSERVDVAPAELGAGPVELVITNQTDAAQRLSLTGEDPGSVLQETPPINPSSTASLKIDLDEGTYMLRTGEGDDIDAATIEVGEPRPSAQDQLLQP